VAGAAVGNGSPAARREDSRGDGEDELRDSEHLRELITATIESCVRSSSLRAMWRPPLVGFASASDARFGELRERIVPSHALPADLLPGAKTIVSYFLPFAESIVRANAADRFKVAREWAEAYRATNVQIEGINQTLLLVLKEIDVSTAAEPPTGRFDRETLTSTWSHKSVAAIAGLGSFGMHRMLITDSGSAGRFGSLVIDADVGVEKADVGAKGAERRERCRYLADGECLECVRLCPVGAIKTTGGFDRQVCWARCQSVAAAFADIPRAEVCGKCATGPCALGAAGRPRTDQGAPRPEEEAVERSDPAAGGG